MIIEVKLEGIEPGILLHNPLSGIRREKTSKPANKIPTKEAEAEAGCYWSKDHKTIVLPGDNLLSAVAQAGISWKAGKVRMASYMSSCLKTDPTDLPFNTTKYEIFEKRVVVQRNGVLRARPLINPWNLSFHLIVEDEYFPIQKEQIPENLKSIFEEAGARIGVGDWRPAKKGRFGRFKVVGWKVIE